MGGFTRNLTFNLISGFCGDHSEMFETVNLIQAEQGQITTWVKLVLLGISSGPVNTHLAIGLV